jgi:hypothetical protein
MGEPDSQHRPVIERLVQFVQDAATGGSRADDSLTGEG